MGDSTEYHNIATELSRGHLHPAAAFRAPLYPIFLAIQYLVFGSGLLLPRLFQIIIGSLTCVLVMQIGKRCFGSTPGVIAGLLTALSGLMLYYDLELLPTTLAIFLFMLLLLELLKIEDFNGSPVKAGVFMGLGALTRPVILPFIPIAVWWLLRRHSDKETSKISSSTVEMNKLSGMETKGAGVSKGRFIRSRFWNFSGFSIGFLAPLILSLAFHIIIGAGPVLVSAQGGVNFYIGNNRASDGKTACFPGVGAGWWGWDHMWSWAETQSGDTLNPSGVDRFYWNESLREIRADPSRWIRLMLRKAGLFWNRTEISSNRDLYYHVSRFPLVAMLMIFGLPLALPLALVGIFRGWRHRGIQLIGLFITYYFVVTIMFFVNARFRLPIVPLLFILTAGGAAAIVHMVRMRKTVVKWTWITTAGLLVIGIVLPLAVDSRIDTRRWDYGLFVEGQVLERLERFDEAEDRYVRALEVNPSAPFVQYYLGKLVESRGNVIRAEELYRSELKIQPGQARVWSSLGKLLLRKGRESEALSCFEKAVSIQPGLQEAAENAARLWGKLGVKAMDSGDTGFALHCLKKALNLEPANTYFQRMLNVAILNQGNRETDPR